MYADAVKCTSSTAGTGALTLSSVAAFVPPSSAFALAQPFAYSIYTGGDSAPVFREAGIGYLSAANTLVRARITATWDGTTTYSAANPTATDFAGAAVTIICTPHASTLNTVLPTVDGQTSGINRFLTSAGRSLAQSPQTLPSLTIYYVPFQIRSAAPIGSLAMNVTGAAAGTAQIGIYQMTEKGYPGRLITSVAGIDTGTTGLKNVSLATPIMLPAGDYFTAMVTSGGPQVTGYTTSGSQIMGCQPFGFNGINPIEFRTENAATAVLPATASSTTTSVGTGAQHPPCVFLGVQ